MSRYLKPQTGSDARAPGANRKRSRLKTATAISSFVLASMAGPALADTVTLKSLDGSVSITGEFLSFEDDTYSIESPQLGTIRLTASNTICEGEACPGTARSAAALRVVASSELVVLAIPKLVEGFGSSTSAKLEKTADENGELLLALKSGSQSDDGAVFRVVPQAPGADLAASKSDFVLTSDLFAANAQDGQSASVLALDGLVIVTSPNNPLRSITLSDAAKIFSGDITNWREVGGHDEAIEVLVLPEGNASSDFFRQKVMGDRGIRFADGAIRARDGDTLAQVIAQNTNAIGFIGFSERGSARPLAIRGACGIQTAATPFTIKTEEYPLTRRIFSYQDGASTQELASQFGDFLQSDLAQTIISETGLVDQLVASVPVDDQGLRLLTSVLPQDAEASLDQLKSMIRELMAADRLSIALRFESGSSRLDPRAEDDVARLVQLIEEGNFVDKEILLLGFTDSVGRGELNQVLSQARASQVRDEILRRLPSETSANVNIQVLGYGEMMPLACNETSAGRDINRRVEIWTRDRVRG